MRIPAIKKPNIKPKQGAAALPKDGLKNLKNMIGYIEPENLAVQVKQPKADLFSRTADLGVVN